MRSRSILRTAMLALSLGVAASAAHAEPIIGLTTLNSLVIFDSATPGTVSAPISITGLGGGERLFDIDLRPQNGRLYGLSNLGNLYSINITTGLATQIGSPIVLDPNAIRFGIDFNPTSDRLRIVSSTGQNLRANPDTGVTTVDTALNGAGSGAVSVAYTNNDLDPATGTSLFYIGANPAMTLFNTSNPNGGVLSLVGLLGVIATQDVGFDISGLSGLAFASLTNPAGGGSSLYGINLTTGAASLVGNIDTGLTLRGIALSPASPVAVTEPGALALTGLGLAGLAASRRRKLK